MNVTKNVPPAGARGAPDLGTTSELGKTFDPNCRLRKLNNAKGQLGSAHQSDNSFTDTVG